MKTKLQSSSGKSMLLALVFLLFCLMLGGTLLAAASANAHRTASQVEMEQCYVNQRSALLLMADLLKSTPEANCQLTIADVETVTEEERERTLIYTIHGPTGRAGTLLQKLLYVYAAGRYEAEYPGVYQRKFVYAKDMNEKWTADTGMIRITPAYSREDGLPPEPLEAEYLFSNGCDLTITLKEEAEAGLYLSMNAFWHRGDPVVTRVDGRTTTTVTTVICWEDPVIEKGDSP